MKEVFEKIIEQFISIRRVVKNDEDLEWNRAVYKCTEIVRQAAGCNNGWIPCSVRLPEESLQSVIGWDAYRERCVFVQYLGVWKLGNWEEVDITHWMDVPHTPKGE